MALTTAPVELITLDDGVTITVDDNSAALTLKSTDADANTGPELALTRDSSSPADDDFTGIISFNADDDGGNVTRFALIRSQIKDASDGSEDGSMDIKTMVAGSERSRVVFGSAETNFNEGGVDLDFRVESDGSTHALFVQASDSAIGINNSSPTAKLHIVEATSTPAVKIKSGTSTNQNTHITMFNDDDGGTLALGVFGSSATTFGPITAGDAFVTSNQELVLNSQNSSGVIKFGVGSTPSEAMRIDSSGRLLVGKTTTAFGTEGVRIDPNNIQVTRDGNTALYLNRLSSSGDLIELYRADSVAATIGVEAYGIVFNEGGAALDFRVESDDRTHMFFVDASGNGVGIGDTTAPGRFLHVQRNSDTDFTTDTFIADSAAIINNATSGANNFASLAFATEANGEIAMGAVENSANSAADFIIVTRDSGSRAQRFKIESSGTTFGGNYFFIVDTDTGILRSSSDELSIRAGGNDRLVVTTSGASTSGSFSKGSGSFKIDHPLPAKTDTHHLVHSFVEGPQADLIYRGSVDLVGGSATVNIDTVAGMTDGTFVLLNTNVQCFTSNESGWTAIKGSVSGNTLTITAQDNTCTDTISWMVVGERQDQHMKDTDWTDSDGKVIVEPEKT